MKMDRYGGWIFAFIGLLILLTIGGCCAVNERQQIERDIDIVSESMFKLQFEIKNPYDQNKVRNAGQNLVEKLRNQP